MKRSPLKPGKPLERRTPLRGGKPLARKSKPKRARIVAPASGEQRAKVEREGCCRACGATGKLDAAHTIPRSLGGGDGEDAILPLCRPCHDQQHRGELELLGLMTRAEQVEAVRVVGLGVAFRVLTNQHWVPAGDGTGTA